MRRAWWRLLLASVVVVATPASAQSQFPSKPIRIVVPYAPGGLTDVVARLFAEQLRQILGRNVVVENKPGASGIIAIEEMARARPDGHTIMIGNISTNALTPVLLAKKLRIDYSATSRSSRRSPTCRCSFSPPRGTSRPRPSPSSSPMPGSIPARSATAAPASAAISRSTPKFSPSAPGIHLLHIPFKGGGAEIIRDLANSDVHVSWFNVTNPIGMMKAGRVRALAIAAEQRLPKHDSVPTLAEIGFPGVRAAQWVAAFAPAAVPADIIDALRKSLRRCAMCVPEMQQAFTTRRHAVCRANPRSRIPGPGCARRWRAGSAILTRLVS